MHRLSGLVFAILGAATAAHAEIISQETSVDGTAVAQVNRFEGEILVNRGAGFVALEDNLSLSDGDRVVLGTEGSAQIAYVNGCEQHLSGMQIVTVSMSAECAKTSDVPALRNNYTIDIQPAQAIGIANVDPIPAFWGWVGLTGIIAILMIFHDEIFNFNDQSTDGPISP